MLNCSLVWVVWKSSKRLATFCCSYIGCCFNAPTVNSQNSSKRFNLKLKHQHHMGIIISTVGNPWSQTRCFNGFFESTNHVPWSKVMKMDLFWGFCCFLFLAIYLPFLPLSLSCVPVCVCVGLRASVRVSHRWVLPGKVQTGHARAGSEALVFLGRHGRVSSMHARTHMNWETHQKPCYSRKDPKSFWFYDTGEAVLPAKSSSLEKTCWFVARYCMHGSTILVPVQQQMRYQMSEREQRECKQCGGTGGKCCTASSQFSSQVKSKSCRII